MSSTESKPQIYCHIIDSTTAKADPSAIEHLFNLTQQIFDEVPWPYPPPAEAPNQSPETAPSSQLPAWQWGIQQPHALIAYASLSSSPDPSTAIGVFFALPCTQPEIGHEIFHLRVATVKAESRGLGIFPLLMAKMQTHARNCGFEEMTVNTFPERFTKMYRILKGNGWEEVAWRRGGQGVLMKIAL